MAKKKKEPATKRTTLAATYRAASTAVVLGTNAAVGAQRHEAPMAIANSYRTNWKENLGAIAVRTADEVLGQRILGHNSALGRGSVTAWIPEVLATGDAAIAGAHNDTGFGTARYTLNKTGFAPGAIPGFVGLKHPQTKLYYGSKLIGGIARKVSTMGPLARVAAPLKKMLGSMGAAL